MTHRRPSKIEDLFHNPSLARYHTYFTEPAPEYEIAVPSRASHRWTDDSALPWLAPRGHSFE